MGVKCKKKKRKRKHGALACSFVGLSVCNSVGVQNVQPWHCSLMLLDATVTTGQALDHRNGVTRMCTYAHMLTPTHTSAHTHTGMHVVLQSFRYARTSGES